MGFEIVIAFLILIPIGIVLTGLILGIVGFARSVGLRKELLRLRRALQAVESRLGGLEAGPRPAERERAAEGAPRPAPPAPGGQREPEAARVAAPSPPITLPPLPAAGPAPTGAVGPPGPPTGPPLAPEPAGEGLARFESKIGKRWMTWLGVGVLFFAAAFFLKHAFENKWIGPTGQVVICALAGVALLVAGSRFAARRWRILGQALMGLGLAVLYASFFAAFSLYDKPVMSQPMAFGFMVVVTIAGLTLAVMHNAMSMAFVAVLGGLLTPVLVSTGRDARDALFTYLLLLDLGVLGVALFRRWRLLDALALTGTCILYAGWHYKFYQPEALGPALAWLGAFYLIFLALPFVYHLLRKANLTVERFVMALVNAAFVSVYAWLMLHEDYQFALGFVALGMAAAYLLLGSLVRRRLPGDARTLFGAVAMTVTFLTLAVPLHLRTHGILLAWAVEGPVLLYLGYRFRYRPVRILAAAALLIAIIRLFASETHWPMHAGLYVPFVNRQFISAMVVSAAMAAFALVHHRFRAQALVPDRPLKLSAALGAGLLALIVLHSETHGWLRNDVSAYAAGCATTGLWAVGAAAYLAGGLRWRSAAGWTWAVGAFVFLIAGVLGARVFGQDVGRAHLLLLNLRFAACLLVVLVAFGYARSALRKSAAMGDAGKAIAAVWFGAGLVGLLALLSVEVYTYCIDVIRDSARARRAAQMAVTIVWGVYAGALVFIGFLRRWRPLRLSGLALFGAAAVKLVLVDLTHVRDIYRIISFLILGLLMVGASYLYHKLEKRLVPDTGPAPPQEPAAEGGSE